MRRYLATLITLIIILTGCMSSNDTQPTQKTEDVNVVEPAEYICDHFNGTLSSQIEGRSFVGTTYKCNISEKWDVEIQSEMNSLFLEDENFGRNQGWKKTYVDTQNYNRVSFSFDAGEYFIADMHIPMGKTNHFFISQ